jgi:hypothetical protein
MEPLKKGQQVVIRPANLCGIVIGPRSADAETEHEGALYQVQIPEQTMWFRRESLEPLAPPNEQPYRLSKEWLAELARFTDLGNRLLASPKKDAELLKQFAESGAKGGLLTAIK